MRCLAKFLPFLILLLASVAAISLNAQTPASFTLHDLGHGVWAAIDNPAAKSAQSGANAGFIIGDDGVLVVDTFQRTEAAQQLLDAIREKTKLPIRFVVNTHYHLDHVMGNNIFANAGAIVLAQDNVRVWERTENKKFFGAKITPEQTKMVESLGLPSLTYHDGVTVYLGSRQVFIHSFPGHTGGDSAVFIPDANVVFMGDLFWCHTLPNLIDASTKPLIDTLDLAIQHHSEATFVPGHGELGHVQDVKDFRNYLADLRNDVAQARSAGKSGDALIAAVLPELQQKYGSWNFFPYFSKTDIHYTDLELAGKKLIPQPPASTH
ncbi:MAG TPA: MBL fold metallo-hydrolase [Verrucomicrobiae bacterium]|nr:MBL fold metallo-hydrolase [Verrucomicrobiae bacterium]